MAARNLGHLYKRQGRYRQADAAYQTAIDSGHPDVAPWAMVYLGNLLSITSEHATDARATYQSGRRVRAPGSRPQAAKRLADLP